ncbi:hypothetical protein ICN18_01295 [Polynucleobacter sp. Ross1-W9]|uniref:hypothetical protein n=1 Tax=Polynucleobacter parvulilacunae TaxID=1855631 RepID=UPI001C0B56B1|nr:hypothetical protein [Polynucleobacter parvulilacunae]MBU3556261.1 hypothetical protein [Polynucleobacter parvulilacunae]
MKNQSNVEQDANFENLVLVKGFDLFFDGICEDDLKKVALDLGGNSSFDFESQKATYMFSKAIYINLDKIHEGHRIADATGKYYSCMYDCNYVVSELYLNVSAKQFNLLKKGWS